MAGLKKNSESSVSEKYSVEDLLEVFKRATGYLVIIMGMVRVKNKKNYDVRDAFKEIQESKVVKYFMNKKKSDTGTFLCGLVNTFEEYKNLENICKHGAVYISGPDSVTDAVKKFIFKQINFWEFGIGKNRVLPHGKKISSFSSLKNKELKEVLQNFSLCLVSVETANLYLKYLGEFYAKSSMYTIGEDIESFKKKYWGNYNLGVVNFDSCRSGKDFSIEKIEATLKKAFNPITLLADKLERYTRLLGMLTLSDTLSSTAGRDFPFNPYVVKLFDQNKKGARALVDTVRDFFNSLEEGYMETFLDFFKKNSGKGVENYDVSSLKKDIRGLESSAISLLLKFTSFFNYFNEEIKYKLESSDVLSELKRKISGVLDEIQFKCTGPFLTQLNNYCERAKAVESERAKEEAERAKEEAERAREEAERARVEAERARVEAERARVEAARIERRKKRREERQGKPPKGFKYQTPKSPPNPKREKVANKLKSSEGEDILP